MGAGSRDPVAVELVPVDQDVAQIVVQAELQEAVAGAGDRPSVLVVVLHNQVASFGCCLKFLVVVGSAATTILNAIDVIVVVNHFMQKGCHHRFYIAA